MPVEDYALIGDTHTAALVGRNGSIDWLCLPRFDSGACFAALLGGEEHGFWRIAPVAAPDRVARRYRGETLVLETEFHTAEGVVRVVDCMPRRSDHASVVRVVEGVSGRVGMRMDLVVRFDYGWVVPWMQRAGDHLHGVAGPDSICLATPAATRGENFRSIGEFSVGPGDRVPFVLSWHPQFAQASCGGDAIQAVAATESWWQVWSGRCGYRGPWRDAVVRSLITLKALTYEPTGGIVAAPTTSLPEQLGGARNWDYRYCWLRDAAFALDALLRAGYGEEARAWRDWLLRVVAGDPAQLQIMYGPAGERRLTELELGWLPGYEDSRPVRTGNAASAQVQLDVYGEVMDALHQARCAGMIPDPTAWALQQVLAGHVEQHWQDPDEGIWEVRSGRRHFTHSKVMAWVAVDRAVQAVERFGLPGPAGRWRKLRTRMHQEICQRAIDPARGCFTRAYGSTELDASLLLLPLVGFLPPSDQRMIRTLKAVQDELCEDGFVRRYRTDDQGAADGLAGSEGAFLACSFWLVDNLALAGRRDEATRLFERLVDLRNDVGLLAEEYDPSRKRLVGNFPQAFSHVGLVNSAFNLAATDSSGLARGDANGPGPRRREGRGDE
ncbi:MAG: glycoside hydrolase family 15 protein [Actinomycetota bacterium]